MGALTPGRSALRLYKLEHRLELPPRSPCVLLSNLPIIPSPTTYRCPGTFLGFSMPGLPDDVAIAAPAKGQASVGFRQLAAGSPQRPAESSSLSLRTDRSPPVAPHPAS